FEGEPSLKGPQTITHRPVSPLAGLRPDLPVGLRMAVEKALEKDTAERYQSMREMVVDLRRLTRERGDGPAPSPPRRARGFKRGAALTLFALVVAGALFISRFRQPAEPARLEYAQLTNFADSAVSPVLSPDGRMLAFIRGASSLGGSPGQIYVKLLPDGEPVQLTKDDLLKV